MTKDKRLEEMEQIQNEKAQAIKRDGLPPLDPEGAAVAEHKRFTFDIVDTPTDPLR